MRGPTASPHAGVEPATTETSTRPLLTVVVPVYNGGDEIVDNVGVIQRTIAAELDGDVEVIVVSDGSIDDTAERLLAARSDAGIRVIHYDRNLGKGYAVKAGALAAHGQWIALVDADLDLDPASIPGYLRLAEEEGLDFAIGSKRHPDSIVQYPRSRRIASWCYQQLNRVLFDLDVRDTQVGLKVFSRRVVDDVMPLLLVKRFAFDLELLAVAASLGYKRVRECPVRLDYRFTGSGVGSLAVLGALFDTAAIFYRLRLLRTYERKRRLFHGAAQQFFPSVTLVGDQQAAALLDYPNLAPDGDIVAVIAPRARPSGNWLTAAVPFFADADVAAVVVPSVAPVSGPVRSRVAVAVLESRLGGGSRRTANFPGNVREVADHPAENVVIRAADYRSALDAGVDGERLVTWLAQRGRRTIYTPDASISSVPPPLVRPHLRATFEHARARGAAAHETRGASLSGATALSLAPFSAAIAGVVVLLTGIAEDLGLALLLIYGLALAVSGVHAAVRFRSVLTGLLEPLAVIASQIAYVVGFVAGVAHRRAD